MTLALLLLLLATATATATRHTKRNPTREQPHIVLEARTINTYAAPAFHEDSFEPPAGVRHEYIVQVKAPIVAAKTVIETDLDVKFGSYMPHNSFMLYATEDVAQRVRQHSHVLWIGSFLPEYKIASVLLDENADQVLEHDLYRFAVHYAGDEPSRDVAARFATRLAEQTPAAVDITRFEPIESSTSTFLVEFAAHGNAHALRVAGYLATQPEVHFIEPLGPMQYHSLEVAKIDLYNSAGGASITSQITGDGVLLGVMDQGIDAQSCFLTGKVVNGGAAPDPHGTAVAAVAGGNAGVATGAKIFFISQQNSAPLTGLKAKLETATKEKVFTMVAAGSPTGAGYNAGAAEMDAYSHEFDRTLFVVAAGNNPKSLSASGYSKNALVVGSASIGPKRGIVGGTSPRVGTKDFRYKPDVISSGDDVTLSGCSTVELNDGTSMAAATAAGAALLVRQYFIDGWWGSGSLTADSKNIGFNPSAALVKAVLVQSATPVTAAQDPSGGAVGAGTAPSIVQGFGRIELANALWFNTSSSFKRMTVSDTVELENDGQFRVCFKLTALGPIRATVAWSDVAGNVAAGHQLVNDIDLVIYSQETGEEWRGNNVAGFDHANNVERIEFTPKALGEYVVVVHGIRLLEKQHFGFIMTGDYAEKPCVGQAVDPQGQFVPTYLFPKCPGGCADYKNDCQNGICVCAGAATGVDCSLVACPDCGLFGECDYAVGACRCVQGRRGDGCAFEYSSVPPEEIFTTRSTSSYRGHSVGTFVGLFIFLYLLGCVLSAVCGVLCGTKYLEYQRDRAR